MSAIITVEKLSKQYNPPKGTLAVRDVSFQVEQGQIFSLLGPNGSGKTSLIGVLSGLLAPTGGEAVINGHAISKAMQKVKRSIGVVPQEIALYAGLSAYENLEFWGNMYGLRGQQRKKNIALVLDITGLAERARDRVATFSGGMKRRLNIAVGLLHNPQIVYMDEPTVGIDPQSRRRILDTIKQLNRQGMTILYTTHYMEEAEELSHRIGILDHGVLIALGTQAELAQQAGECSTLHVTVGNIDHRLMPAVDVLSRLPGVSQCRTEGENTVVMQTREAHCVLPAVVSCLSQAGLSIQQLEIRKPDLESLFLQLTGRALRD